MKQRFNFELNKNPKTKNYLFKTHSKPLQNKDSNVENKTNPDNVYKQIDNMTFDEDEEQS